jgi:hypothetical protein
MSVMCILMCMYACTRYVMVRVWIGLFQPTAAQLIAAVQALRAQPQSAKVQAKHCEEIGRLLNGSNPLVKVCTKRRSTKQTYASLVRRSGGGLSLVLFFLWLCVVGGVTVGVCSCSFC